MSEIITIFDPDSKKLRNGRDFHVKHYETSTDGQSQKVVEYTVVGKNREWPLFCEFDKFMEFNPDVDVRDDESGNGLLN